MSDSQAYEKVTVGSDGVTVTKRFEEDEFPVPAIAFEFVSERDEQVRIRLSDQVPEGVAVEDLGFHPEYGSEYWTIDEETITFERDMGARAEYTTVYGIRATGADDVEQFLTTPVIEEVDPPLPESERPTPTNDGGDEVVPESEDDVVRDVIAGEGEVPGLEEEGEGGGDEEIETLDLTDPNAPEDGSEDEDGGDGEPVDVTSGNVVGAMATQIRNGNVAVDDLKLLKRAFDHVAEEMSDGSTDARITRLQSDVADLRAYTDALEEFLDENGTGQQLIEDVESQLEDLSSELGDMQSDLQANSATLGDVNESVASVREEMDDVTAEVDEMGNDIDRVSSEVNSVSGDLGEIESAVDDLDEAVVDLRSTVEELETEVTEGDVMDRIDDLELDLQNLQEWQEQIKETFGG